MRKTPLFNKVAVLFGLLLLPMLAQAEGIDSGDTAWIDNTGHNNREYQEAP